MNDGVMTIMTFIFWIDLQVHATDEDSGLFGQITYSFVNDLGKTQFSIDANGVISTIEKLDRENPVNKDMVLTVMALDGGGIISDIIFSSYV